ncbi:hypothetical protein K798_19593, partial [Salmonella enterica subsp. enterica serovar Newport str. SHSN007]
MFHFRHQRPLALPIICILFNLLADFPLACRVFTQLLRQLRQPLRELLRRTRWVQTGGGLLKDLQKKKKKKKMNIPGRA